jgi:hypothetical protein
MTRELKKEHKRALARANQIMVMLERFPVNDRRQLLSLMTRENFKKYKKEH